MAITRKEVYSRLKPLLAKIKKYSKKEIRMRQRLRDDLGFDEVGLSGLSTRIKKEFADVNLDLKATSVIACVFVRDLSRLIWSEIPKEHKA